jgi:glycine cleavage system H protein
MNFPEELLYVKSHEWVQKQEDGTYYRLCSRCTR